MQNIVINVAVINCFLCTFCILEMGNTGKKNYARCRENLSVYKES